MHAGPTLPSNSINMELKLHSPNLSVTYAISVSAQSLIVRSYNYYSYGPPAYSNYFPGRTFLIFMFSSSVVTSNVNAIDSSWKLLLHKFVVQEDV